MSFELLKLLNAHLAASRVIADPPTTHLGQFTSQDARELNEQTAFNWENVTRHAWCGCFRCGGRFRGEELADWMEEDNGARTALCPACGTDALVVGIERHPLSTVVLDALNRHWFGEERRKRLATPHLCPSFSDYEDYARRGLSFDLAPLPEGSIDLGGFDLFNQGRIAGACRGWDAGSQPWGDADWRLPDGTLKSLESETPLDHAGGTVDIGGTYEFDGFTPTFTDLEGRTLPHEPWGQGDRKLLEELWRAYGSRLKGSIQDAHASRMLLFALPSES